MRIYSAALAIVLAGAGCAASAQLGSTSSGQTSNSRAPFGTQTPGDPNPISPATLEHLERGRQSDRQKKLIADTDRLLFLANELKADMDKTTKDTLSIEVIRKAEEIEKLAHNVKERMKG